MKGNIQFRLRFNTMHGDTDLYWRVIIIEDNEPKEFLARSVNCMVPTCSDASFDKNANAIKYHMAGNCTEFNIDCDGKATLK
jgi:hypothetical protein